MSAGTFSIRDSQNGRTLVLGGDWSSLTLGDNAMDLREALSGATGPTTLDLSAIGKLDTAGAYAILYAVLPTLAPSPMSREAERLFTLVKPAVEEELAPDPSTSRLYAFFEDIGRSVIAVGQEIRRAAEFAGHLNIEIARTILSPSRLRAIPLARAMETTGINALPIIMTMMFFIGAVVALVGTDMLASLGVAIFTVQLIGVAVLREFAVLITGILLAGRSASSFAAQIGSMKMAQEVDAMQVIGVDPFQALVIPRVFALVLMMPILTFAGMLAGIAGGLIVCWLALDISPIFFFERMRATVEVRHFWVGLSKTPVLALLIAMAGCRHGLSVGGDVESLGSRVTTAVVQSIFMIILVDALFAIIYMELNL